MQQRIRLNAAGCDGSPAGRQEYRHGASCARRMIRLPHSRPSAAGAVHQDSPC
jgi:hypothetical protein